MLGFPLALTVASFPSFTEAVCHTIVTFLKSTLLSIGSSDSFIVNSISRLNYDEPGVQVYHFITMDSYVWPGALRD